MTNTILFASIQTISGHNGGGDSAFRNWLKEFQEPEKKESEKKEPENEESKKKLYIIYDEVHHIGANKIDEFFGRLFGTGSGGYRLKKYALIGLTGTVYRYSAPVESFNKWFKYGWDGAGRKIVCSDKMEMGTGDRSFINNRIEIVTVRDLIKKKILIMPEIIRVEDFKNGMPENKELYLANKIRTNYFKQKWGKTIVFVKDISSAKSLGFYLEFKPGIEDYEKEICDRYGKKMKDEKENCKKLRGRNVKCFVYTSSGYNQTDLNKFIKVGGGKNSLMIAVDMVSEGFDVQDIQTIYLYSKIKSQIRLRQRIGRVLRTSEEKKKATVYWQKYFGVKDRKEDIPVCGNDISESEEDIQEDIASWRKGMQLPAGMFLEPLPADSGDEGTAYRKFEFLSVMELFGLETALGGIGYYQLDTSKIYVRKQEKLGYEQFYRMICTDYFSILFEENNDKFEKYAKALGVSERDLLEDIKVNCFYMPNIDKDDKSGKINIKKRFIVKDDDIIMFYEWVVKYELAMPDYVSVTGGEEGTRPADENEETEPETGNGQTAIPYEADIIQKYMKDPKTQKTSKKNSLLEGMQLHQEIRRKLARKRNKNRIKEYADFLTYGRSGGFIYQEFLSARTIINFGAFYEKRETGRMKGIEWELAFIGKKKDKGGYCQIKALPRIVKNIAEEDSVLYAETLVTVPNHISIKKEDVDEYRNMLISSLPKIPTNPVTADGRVNDKLVNEFIMALGYKNGNINAEENDDIIRMQCEIFPDKQLPRILQYAIYCRAYRILEKHVDFFDGDDIKPDCVNKDELHKKYKELLESYGAGALDQDLTPVEDVITDRRPYLKAVPYYQGIKPEFLCRMLNTMLWMGGRKGWAFIDAFGGSGTVSMNMDSALSLRQSYNDMGIFNKAFFSVVKDDIRSAWLKKKIRRFIDMVLEC